MLIKGETSISKKNYLLGSDLNSIYNEIAQSSSSNLGTLNHMGTRDTQQLIKNHQSLVSAKDAPGVILNFGEDKPYIVSKSVVHEPRLKNVTDSGSNMFGKVKRHSQRSEVDKVDLIGRKEQGRMNRFGEPKDSAFDSGSQTNKEAFSQNERSQTRDAKTEFTLNTENREDKHLLPEIYEGEMAANLSMKSNGMGTEDSRQDMKKLIIPQVSPREFFSNNVKRLGKEMGEDLIRTSRSGVKTIKNVPSEGGRVQKSNRFDLIQAQKNRLKAVIQNQRVCSQSSESEEEEEADPYAIDLNTPQFEELLKHKKGMLKSPNLEDLPGNLKGARHQMQKNFEDYKYKQSSKVTFGLGSMNIPSEHQNSNITFKQIGMHRLGSGMASDDSTSSLTQFNPNTLKSPPLDNKPSSSTKSKNQSERNLIQKRLNERFDDPQNEVKIVSRNSESQFKKIYQNSSQQDHFSKDLTQPLARRMEHMNLDIQLGLKPDIEDEDLQGPHEFEVDRANKKRNFLSKIDSVKSPNLKDILGSGVSGFVNLDSIEVPDDVKFGNRFSSGSITSGERGSMDHGIYNKEIDDQDSDYSHMKSGEVEFSLECNSESLNFGLNLSPGLDKAIINQAPDQHRDFSGKEH